MVNTLLVPVCPGTFCEVLFSENILQHMFINMCVDRDKDTNARIRVISEKTTALLDLTFLTGPLHQGRVLPFLVKTVLSHPNSSFPVPIAS